MVKMDSKMTVLEHENAWERFISKGEIDSQEARDVIARSWLRCRQRGVDPLGGSSNVIATGKELEALLVANRDLIDAAKPFMQRLYKLVESSGFIVVLAEKSGFLLEVIGDTDVLESHRGTYYVKGVKWSEELVGTTAISLALLEHESIQVAGSEHYCKELHGWACSAAPLSEDNGNIIGALSVIGPNEKVHCHTLGMVVSASAAITNILQVQKAHRHSEETARIHSTIVNSVSDGLLMLDAKGTVTYINPVGAHILKVNAADAVGKHISSLVDFKPVVLQVLETGQGYTDKEFFIQSNNSTLHFIKTAIPLKNKEGRLDGVIDIFKEIKRVHKLVNQMVGATAEFYFEDIIGNHPAMRESVRLGKIAANSIATVLIQGESGTGKELFAQAIHNSSSRRNGPFVALNCGAIPRNLVESELFGYEEGSFTGAKSGGRPGKFELAQGGTFFLDEIGEMPRDMQVKLLRVLQEKRITRVGGNRCIDTDVRIIAATNRDLAKEVNDGNFRQDLYYRLNVLPIQVPPLRERKEDILLFVRFLTNKMCQQLGVKTKDFSAEALTTLAAYDWPGNVRELENVIERAINTCEGSKISIEFLPRTLLEKPAYSDHGRASLKDMERRVIEETIRKTGGHISNTAKILGIRRNTLYSKLKKYAIPYARNEVFADRTPSVR